METTILGGKGFVGSEYVRRFSPSFVNERNDYGIYTPDVLYFISTVTNHNIFRDVHVDINTNLNVLTATLDNWRKRGEHGVFNFISSWFVYGYGTGFTEESECHPEGFYSITKRCAEQLLECYCKTFNLKYRILRLANVIGPGDTKVSTEKNVLQYLINKMKKHETIQLVDGGMFYRDYIHVEDCVDAVHKVLSAGQVNTVYNIGNQRPMLFRDAVYCAWLLTHSNSEIVEKEGTAHSFSMYADKLRELGYYPRYTGADLLKTLV